MLLHSRAKATSALEIQGSDTSRVKQKRQRKAFKHDSVLCGSCSAEYHIPCLIKAYKDYKCGLSKSQQRTSTNTTSSSFKDKTSAAEKRAYNKSANSLGQGMTKNDAAMSKFGHVSNTKAAEK